MKREKAYPEVTIAVIFKLQAFITLAFILFLPIYSQKFTLIYYIG